MKAGVELNRSEELIHEFAQTVGLTSKDMSVVTAGLMSEGLARPDSIIVYLDLNHWISLAKALKGKEDAKIHKDSLDFLSAASDSGNIVIPLSVSTYMEVSKIASVDRRNDVAIVMSRISHFATLLSPTQALDFEVASAFRRRFPQLEALPPPIKLGFGFMFAFGQGSGPSASISVLDSDQNEVDRRKLTSFSNQLMEYLVLRGPSPNDITDMEGFNQYASLHIADQRAKSEQRISEIVKVSNNPQVSLEDVVRERLFCDYVVPRLPPLLALADVRKESFDDFDKQWYTEFLEDIPFIAVQIALINQINKNGSREWKSNDINDMDALGLAVPYCDIVATERFACDVLNRSRIADRFQTVIIPTLEDLIQELKSRI